MVFIVWLTYIASADLSVWTQFSLFPSLKLFFETVTLRWPSLCQSWQKTIPMDHITPVLSLQNTKILNGGIILWQGTIKHCTSITHRMLCQVRQTSFMLKNVCWLENVFKCFILIFHYSVNEASSSYILFVLADVKWVISWKHTFVVLLAASKASCFFDKIPAP